MKRTRSQQQLIDQKKSVSHHSAAAVISQPIQQSAPNLARDAADLKAAEAGEFPDEEDDDGAAGEGDEQEESDGEGDEGDDAEGDEAEYEYEEVVGSVTSCVCLFVGVRHSVVERACDSVTARNVA